MNDHTYLVTPQFIEEKSQENSNASRRDWFLSQDFAYYRTKGASKPWLQYCQLNIGKSSSLLLLRSIK
jgi:hypothetical protein